MMLFGSESVDWLGVFEDGEGGLVGVWSGGGGWG